MRKTGSEGATSICPVQWLNTATSEVHIKMKRRITFVHQKEDTIDPQEFEILNSSIYIRDLKAAREDRWTASSCELPQEVSPSIDILICTNTDGDRYG